MPERSVVARLTARSEVEAKNRSNQADDWRKDNLQEVLDRWFPRRVCHDEPPRPDDEYGKNHEQPARQYDSRPVIEAATPKELPAGFDVPYWCVWLCLRQVQLYRNR